VNIDEHNLRQRLAFLEIDQDEAGHLARMWEVLRATEDADIERFYDHIGAFAETGSYISGPEQVERLRRVQQRYARELFQEPCGLDYVQNRLRIGQVHHRIGLEPHWYLAACSKLLTSILDSSAPMREDPHGYAAALKAVVRRLFLDVGLVMDAYVAADRAALSAANAELRDSQAQLTEAHELAQLARWELHLPSGALSCCARACDMLHAPAEASRGGYEQLRQWVHPLDRRDLDAAFRAAVASGSTYDVRYRVERPGYPALMLRERGRALPGAAPGQVRVVGTVQDISLQASQLSRIEQLALYDDLTRLPNRASFYGELERHIEDAAASGRVFALLFIDLDQFKEINDTKGHSIGDAVLIEVARRLTAELRPGEVVARLGGDEFVVLATGADEAVARVVATRMAEAIRPPMAIGGYTLSARASIGISVYPRDGTSSELLVRNADTAMYSAKRAHHGIQCYHPRMSARLARRVQLAERLAVALREGQLQLYYQPQLRIDQDRLIGAEALLRWNDPLLGPVSPQEFVAVAEHRGLMDALGEWVFTQACRQWRAWRMAGLSLPPRLAINISPRQFDAPGLAQRLIRIALAEGLDPCCLELELTESGLMADPAESLATLAALREAGFSLSLDDFGMGYSSLSHLKGFPLDRLKLDRAFVQGMLNHRHDYAIVVAAQALASSLDLELVAEGVEQVEQAQRLRQLGCCYAQGYLYDPALPPEDFAQRWLATPSPLPVPSPA